MTSASYHYGILWIAENDEPNDLEPVNVARYVSTALIADLFGKDPYTVALAVVRRRKARDAQERYDAHAPHNR